MSVICVGLQYAVCATLFISLHILTISKIAVKYFELIPKLASLDTLQFPAIQFNKPAFLLINQ